MASTLVELSNEMKTAKQTPESSPAPVAIAQSTQTEPPKRGDDLMAKAMGHAQVSDDETRLAKLFFDSHQMVNAKMQADPEYAAKIAPELQKLTGKGHEFSQKIIDEADDMKIKAMESDPKFNADQAANFAFFNTATFGQLSKIFGKAGELIDGRPYEETVNEYAEKMRLLKKAYPKTNLAYEALAYLVPGSPVKALFGKAAQFGEKIGELIGPMTTKLANNPEILNKLITSASSVGAGAAAVSGVEGAAGTNLQKFSLDRGIEHSLKSGYNGALLGFLAPAAAGIAGGAAEVATPYVRTAVRKAGDVVDNVVSGVTGVEANALRAFNKNPSALKSAAGTEDKIGADLTDFLFNQKKARLPEHDAADQLLDALPNVDASKMVNYLRSYKKGANPKLDSQIDLLHEWADRLEQQLAPGAKKVANNYISSQQAAIESAAAQKVSALQESIARKRAIINSTIEIQGKGVVGTAEKAQGAALKSAEASANTTSNLLEIQKNAAQRLKMLDADLAKGMSEIEAFKVSSLAQIKKDATKLASESVGSELKNVSARKMREAVSDLQDAALDQFGEQSNLYVSALKVASRRGRVDLVETARNAGGEAGKNYADLMDKVSEKVGLLKYVGKQLGRTVEAQEKNSERFISTMFGKNKTLLRQRMGELDQKFGTNFLELAEHANAAKQVGKGGVPGILPASPTGKSLLGTGLSSSIGGGVGALVAGPAGAVAGGAIGGAIGTAASSPRAGAAIIGMSDSISGFVNRMVANPEAVARLAGRMTAKGNYAGAARLNVPIEIRALSDQIYKAFQKDGPISAASSTRLIADTPYFLGLVHYFDVAERQQTGQGAISGIAKQKTQSNEISTNKQ